MFKKIVVDCKSKKTAFSSGYTVPQGKVFLLTGLMVRKREYTDKYSNNTIERVDVTTSIYILNQDGSGFKSGGYHSDQNKFD